MSCWTTGPLRSTCLPTRWKVPVAARSEFRGLLAGRLIFRLPSADALRWGIPQTSAGGGQDRPKSKTQSPQADAIRYCPLTQLTGYWMWADATQLASKQLLMQLNETVTWVHLYGHAVQRRQTQLDYATATQRNSTGHDEDATGRNGYQLNATGRDATSTDATLLD
jgi:hypothetical protein